MRHTAWIISVAVLLTACGGRETPSPKPSPGADSTAAVEVINLHGWQLTDSLRIDVTGDGMDELIVLSRTDSLDSDPLLQDCFDRLDIFETSHTPYRTLFFDLVDYGTTIVSKDVTGDGVTDILVQLDAGGNNPISARGMHLYGLDSTGSVTLLFLASSGAPQVKDLDGDDVSEILVADQFWGMMAHSEVIGFTREVYAFDGSAYVRANERFALYFDEMIRSRRSSYERVKSAHTQTEEARSNLYARMADYLVWSWARGGAARCAVVWREEKEFLRGALHSEQFDDLEHFVDEAYTMEYEQAGQQNS